MTEIEKLINKLAKADIPYELTVLMKTIQVWYPTHENPVCDVVCHEYSYGGKEGLLEIMGLVDEAKTGDTVEGYLTADEVFDRIAHHYRTHLEYQRGKADVKDEWVDYWYVDNATGEEFLVEVRNTDSAEDEADQIAQDNFEDPMLLRIISPEEADCLGIDTL